MQGLGFWPSWPFNHLNVRPQRRTPRTAEWLESLGEWSWPGQRVATAEVLPPAWVPVHPPAPAAAPAPLPAPWLRARRLAIAILLIAVALVGGALALQRPLGLRFGSSGTPAARARAGARTAPAGLLPQAKLTPISRDHAGSAIEKASYASVALHHGGSFYVYLPPGFKAAAAARYPVIYLLHGNSQSATAFLQIGLQGELD